MESKGLLFFSKLPANCSYPEPDQSSPVSLSADFLKIHFNFTFTSTPGASMWSLFLILPHQNYMHLSCTPHVPYAPPISFFFILSPTYSLVKNADLLLVT